MRVFVQLLAPTFGLLFFGPPEGVPTDPTAVPDHSPTASAEAGDSRPPEATAPPMPEVEELPARRPVLDFDPKRGPAGSSGGSFFDPGKLADTGPGGIVQVRGYVGAGFFVIERTNVRERRDDGTFDRLDPLPFFGGSVATLYVGAAIWADAVYARITLDYLSIPQITAGSNDIIAPASRQLLMESAAIEVNPFFWAKKAGRWLREGFKITAGVFIVPFGLEDEDHAAPINWFVTRTRTMTIARIYPGTWSDIGAMVKWKPTFREHKPVRPIELDLGFVNGDPCTQTRFADTLYQPTQQPAPCERELRPEELAAGESPAGSQPRADIGVLGLAQDNNRNKAVVTRVKFFPLPALDFGGSFVWGKHPRMPTLDERLRGLSTVDLAQAPTWRAGAHLELDFDQMFSTRYPLPKLRGEFVAGVDAAVAGAEGLADRRVMGGYVQAAQPLYRRKRSNIPGLMLQYRFDYADPDLDVPNGDPVRRSDFSDAYLYDEAIVSHTIGLNLPVVPRFSMKTEYTFLLEDGGAENQLYNDHFAFQLVADF